MVIHPCHHHRSTFQRSDQGPLPAAIGAEVSVEEDFVAARAAVASNPDFHPKMFNVCPRSERETAL